MDYKEIMNKVKKYYYYVVTTNITKCISSSNNKSKAKKLALEELKKNTDIDKIIGKKLIFVKIKLVIKKFEKQKTTEELKLIGGPILVKFKRAIIESSNKISNISDVLNNKIYLSNKYIKKNQDNIAFNLDKLVRDFVSNKFNQGLLAMTIL